MNTVILLVFFICMFVYQIYLYACFFIIVPIQTKRKITPNEKPFPCPSHLRRRLALLLWLRLTLGHDKTPEPYTVSNISWLRLWLSQSVPRFVGLITGKQSLNMDGGFPSLGILGFQKIVHKRYRRFQIQDYFVEKMRSPYLWRCLGFVGRRLGL